MMKFASLWALLCFSIAANAQNADPVQTSPPPSYANYSLMLVSPANGNGVVLMHNPKNELEFVDTSRTKEALSAGYVPVRAVELAELIDTLRQENAELSAENTRLRNLQAQQDTAVVSSAPPPADPQAIERSQREARRQQLIQAWLMLQMNKPAPYQIPMPVNPNAGRLQTHCTTTNLAGTATTDCN
jgi:hypothetical protein